MYLTASFAIGSTVAGIIASDRDVVLITPYAVGLAFLLFWPLIIALAILSLPVMAGIIIGRQFA